MIVGRGAPFFLREREDTFRVFTYAPHDEKIRRLLRWARAAKKPKIWWKTWIRSAWLTSNTTSMPSGPPALPLSHDDQHSSRE